MKRKKVIATGRWIKRIEVAVGYPHVSIMVAAVILSIACKSLLLAVPGIFVLIWATLYIYWIGDRVRAAYRGWKTSHEQSSELPTRLWRLHVRLHSIFVAKQSVFLWGTFLIGIIVYIGIIAFCELGYGVNYTSQIPPGLALQRLIYSIPVGIVVSFWSSYTKVHLEWAADDEWRKETQC